MKSTTPIAPPDRLDRARSNCTARLAAATPLLLMSVYLYGPRPLVLCAIAVVTAVLCDLLACALRGRSWQPKDLSSLLFALLLTLLVPASLPYYILAVAVAIGILVGKHLFGGFGSYPFHPTALGYVIAAVSWPAQMLSFPAPAATPAGWLPLWGPVAAVEAPAATLKLGGLPTTSDVNLLLGNFAGPLGATTALLALACGLMMLAVGRFDVAAPLSFAATCVWVVRRYPRVLGVEFSDLLWAELLTTGLAFGAVFLLQDEVTLPRRVLARVLYGILVGLLTMGYQYYGSCPIGICFGILWGNALSDFLERLAEATQKVAAALWQRALQRLKGRQKV